MTIRQPSMTKHMLALQRKALDEAYVENLKHLFSVWMKDSTDQPQRAINGAKKARDAYLKVAEAIDKRDEEQGF